MKKIVNYKLFNEQRLNRDILKTGVLNEGLISNFFSKIFKSGIFTKLSKWAQNFIDKIIKNKIQPIGSGPNAGKPSAFLFLPENGDLFTQMSSIYKFDNDLGAAISINESLELNEDLSHLKSRTKNIADISAAELIDLLEETYENDMAGYRKSIFIYGAPGIGKTKIITEAAKRIGGSIIFMDLQFYNPDDFAGLLSKGDIRPHGYKTRKEMEDEISKRGRKDVKNVKEITFDKETGEEIVLDYGEGFSRRNLPTIFPREGDNRRGIIFMDELNRANSFVLNSLMTFLGGGRNIENYTLPKGWIIVAAGNRKWDDPEFFDEVGDAILGDPFIQRFEAYNYLPSFEEWASWARKANVLPELIDWLELPNIADEWWHRPYTDKTSKNLEYDKGTPWASPRAWTELAAKLALKCKRENVPILIPIEDNIIPKLPGEIQKIKLRNLYLTPLVGFDAATAFMDYLDIITKVTLPQRQEIYATPTLAPIPDSMKDKTGITSGVFYAVTRFLLKNCEVPNDSAQTITNVAHTLVWANKIGKPEMSTFLLRICKEIYPQLDKSKLNHITEEIQDIFYEYVDDPEDPAQINTTVTYGTPKPVDYICGKILKRINSDYPNETDWDIDHVKAIRAIILFNLIEETGKGNLGDKIRSFKQNRLNRKK